MSRRTSGPLHAAFVAWDGPDMLFWVQVMSMDKSKTGALIAAARKEKNMTQKELAESLHVSDRAVSKWERGAGFPDVSLLEPLADALGLSVISLLHGERTDTDAAGEQQVREAIRVVTGEMRKWFHKALRVAQLCLGLFLAAALLWKGYEFMVTNGDGFNPIENPRVIGTGYENNCKGMAERGIYQIEVRSEDRYTILTDSEDISDFLDTIAQIEVQGEYRNWGPDSLDHTVRISASGWTPDDRFIDTDDYVFVLSFPAFTAGMEGEEPLFYFQAEIGGQDAWSVVTEKLDQMTGIKDDTA